MVDAEPAEKTFSDRDEHDVYEPVEFDPECTFVPSWDDEPDGDTMAFRDALRDIWATEGRFELLLI